MLEATSNILPLVLFYLFFAFTDDFLHVSITPLGRFIAVLLILFYSIKSKFCGIIMCIIVILYYRLSFVEKTSMFDSCMLVNKQIESFVPKNSSIENEKLDNFRKKHCENNELIYKKNKVKCENADHVFEELEFLNEPCNPCTPYCGFTIQEKIKTEQDVVYPKTQDTWVYSIWNTWFKDGTSPSAFNNIYTKSYDII